MFNATEILIDAFGRTLRDGYRRMYGGLKPDYEDIIAWAGSMSLENIANSDALYHNVEHTILVTLVGQEILRGKHMREGGVTPDDWLLYIISLLSHDIGFVRGVCRADRRDLNHYATGPAPPTSPPPAATPRWFRCPRAAPTPASTPITSTAASCSFASASPSTSS